MKRILFALCLVSCTHAPSPAVKAPADFSSFVDAYYAASFARNPSAATRVGFHEGDAKLEDRSRAATEARIAELHTLLDQLTALRCGELSFDDAIDAQLLDGQIRSALLDLETLRTW